MAMPGMPGLQGAKMAMLKYEGLSPQGFSYGEQMIRLDVIDEILVEEIKYVQVRRQFSTLPAKIQKLLKANWSHGTIDQVVLLEAILR